MARQKDSLSLSAKKIRRRARFFLSFFFFCPKRGEACGRCNYYFEADIERSVCFEMIFFGSAPIRSHKKREDERYFRYFGDKNLSRGPSTTNDRSPKMFFFFFFSSSFLSSFSIVTCFFATT